jgi:hypothetical protein
MLTVNAAVATTVSASGDSVAGGRGTGGGFGAIWCTEWSAVEAVGALEAGAFVFANFRALVLLMGVFGGG